MGYEMMCEMVMYEMRCMKRYVMIIYRLKQDNELILMLMTIEVIVAVRPRILILYKRGMRIDHDPLNQLI